MTKSDGKYPNKDDLEPKVRGAVNPDELPLADPADSSVTNVGRKSVRDKTRESEQSAYGVYKEDSGYNKPKLGESFPFGDREQYERKFNQESHDKWNEQKPNKVPLKP